MPDIVNPPRRKKKKKDNSYLYHYEMQAFAVGTPLYKFESGCFGKAAEGDHEMADGNIASVDSNGKITAFTNAI